MRLIIEIENDEELKQAQSLIASLSFSSVEVKTLKRQKIQNLLRWCDKNKFTLNDGIIPSREERNAR